MIGKTVIDMLRALEKSSKNKNLTSLSQNNDKLRQVLKPTIDYLERKKKYIFPHDILRIYLHLFFSSSQRIFDHLDDYTFRHF